MIKTSRGKLKQTAPQPEPSPPPAPEPPCEHVWASVGDRDFCTVCKMVGPAPR